MNKCKKFHSKLMESALELNCAETKHLIFTHVWNLHAHLNATPHNVHEILDNQHFNCCKSQMLCVFVLGTIWHYQFENPDNFSKHAIMNLEVNLLHLEFCLCASHKQSCCFNFLKNELCVGPFQLVRKIRNHFGKLSNPERS